MDNDINYGHGREWSGPDLEPGFDNTIGDVNDRGVGDMDMNDAAAADYGDEPDYGNDRYKFSFGETANALCHSHEFGSMRKMLALVGGGTLALAIAVEACGSNAKAISSLRERVLVGCRDTIQRGSRFGSLDFRNVDEHGGIRRCVCETREVATSVDGGKRCTAERGYVKDGIFISWGSGDTVEVGMHEPHSLIAEHTSSGMAMSHFVIYSDGNKCLDLDQPSCDHVFSETHAQLMELIEELRAIPEGLPDVPKH